MGALHSKLIEGCWLTLLFLDFSKAFYVVRHSILLRQLTAIDLSRPLMAWIKTVLSGRTIRVSCGGTSRSTRGVLNEVPQESVIGPHLFLVYIILYQM